MRCPPLTSLAPARTLCALGLLVSCGDEAPPDSDGDPTTSDACTDYPEQFDIVASGEIFPPYRWTNAYWQDDETPSLDFGLTEFFCSPDWSEYNSLLLVVGAAWCGACAPHAQLIDSISSELRENGTLVAYLLIQNEGGGLATGFEANTWTNAAIGDGWGLRLGDGENSELGAIAQRANPVPTGYFIRKSDMMLLAAENEIGSTLPYTEISQDPSRDWPSELGVMFHSNCPPATEESSEPNNSLERAEEISTMTTIEGGVCDSAPDFFRVGVTGSWDVALEYDASVADLDLAVVSAQGERLSGASQEETRKFLIFAGEQYIMVSGPGRVTAPYTLTVHPW